MRERTTHGVEFVIVHGGFHNPDADKPCGALNPEALLPEPQHLQCKECRRIIVDMLKSRMEHTSFGKPATQMEFDFAIPKATLEK